MTQILWLDPLFYKNRWVHSFRHTPGMSILGFVDKVICERLGDTDNTKGDNTTKSHRKDFLAHFLEIQEANPDLPPW